MNGYLKLRGESEKGEEIFWGEGNDKIVRGVIVEPWVLAARSPVLVLGERWYRFG